MAERGGNSGAGGERIDPHRANRNSRGLTPRQAAFCAEYVVDLNGAQAALRAGYAADPDRNNQQARNQAAELLKKPHVRAEIQRLMDERSKRTRITADRVLEELALIAFGSTRGLFDDSGRLLKPHEWDPDVATAIAAVEVVTRNLGEGEVEHVAKIKQWDKVKALELLAKHLKLLTDRVEHDVADGLAAKLAAARERVRRGGEDDSEADEQQAGEDGPGAQDGGDDD